MSDCVFQPLSGFRSDTLQHTPIVLPEDLKQAVHTRQQAFLAGRYCAYALFEKWQCPWNGLAITASRSPDWPKGFKGSITHSKSLAAAVMLPDTVCAGIGIDAEHFLPETQAERVKYQILHAAETWATTPEHLTVVFSLKESIYKALNPVLRRFISFQEVYIHAPENLAEITRALQTRKQGQVFSFAFEPVGELAKDFPVGFALQGLICIVAGPEPQVFSRYGTFYS